MTSEQKARVSIDALLSSVGCHERDSADSNSHKTASVACLETLVSADRARAQALRQAILRSGFPVSLQLNRLNSDHYILKALHVSL